jgi:hypothetical protein
MTVTFGNGMHGKEMLFRSATSSTGARFANPGSLAPGKNPLKGSATMGASSDDRVLPEWVEFDWTEPDYGTTYTREQLRAMPVKKARVPVRSRVPQDVVDEVVASNRQRQAGQLSEGSLWIYFVWFDSGVKFRWELRSGCCEKLRAGGDDLGP